MAIMPVELIHAAGLPRHPAVDLAYRSGDDLGLKVQHADEIRTGLPKLSAVESVAAAQNPTSHHLR